jgi:hypothetical protein
MSAKQHPSLAPSSEIFLTCDFESVNALAWKLGHHYARIANARHLSEAEKKHVRERLRTYTVLRDENAALL